MSEFFISYASNDLAWAEWVAWHIEAAGHKAVLQAWDFAPGSNFVLAMQEASKSARATIAILSEEYLARPFPASEWAAAFSKDPNGSNTNLIPIRISDVEPEGILSSIVYIDLFDVPNVETAIRRLLEGIVGARRKPQNAPAFPYEKCVNGKPSFPGVPKNKHEEFADNTIDHSSQRQYSNPTPTNSHSAGRELRVSLSRLPSTTSTVFDRDEVIEKLKSTWNDGSKNIIVLNAWGGVGKTTVVNSWLAKMATCNYKNAKDVFGWSFYGQSITEQGSASSDHFLTEALEFFGDPDPSSGTSWEKGYRLASYTKKGKTILVLDGVEVLQNPSGELEGRLRDIGVRVLVKELAARYCQMLCIKNLRNPLRGAVFTFHYPSLRSQIHGETGIAASRRNALALPSIWLRLGGV